MRFAGTQVMMGSGGVDGYRLVATMTIKRARISASHSMSITSLAVHDCRAGGFSARAAGPRNAERAPGLRGLFFDGVTVADYAY